MAYLEVFIDGFAYFFLFPYIIYDHLKCVSRLRATLYLEAFTLNGKARDEIENHKPSCLYILYHGQL